MQKLDGSSAAYYGYLQRLQQLIQFLHIPEDCGFRYCPHTWQLISSSCGHPHMSMDTRLHFADLYLVPRIAHILDRYGFPQKKKDLQSLSEAMEKAMPSILDEIS